MQYDDDQCPARGAGLGHIADGEPDCSYCGVARQRHRPPTPTVRRIEPRRRVMSGDHSAPTPGDPIAELRARFIAEQEGRLMSTLCATCNKHRDRRGALCDECTFNRRLAFQRYRFETGQMSEWVVEPAVVPRPITPVGHGSLDDWSPESIQLAVSRHG